MKYFKITIILIIISAPLTAHNNWINFTKNGKVNIQVCNGHHFPGSDLLLMENIIQYVKLINPDGKRTAIKTTEKGKYRTADLNIRKPGTYIIISALKNPPRYFLKTILTIGKPSNQVNLNAGETLEIIPEKVPSTLTKGNKLKLKILYNNKPVQTGISFSINGKSNFSTFTNSKGEFTLRIRSQGKYLVTSSFEGKHCSLVFDIP